MEGDKEAGAIMEEYNIHDVKLLGPLYEFLLPWIKDHPNWALYNDAEQKCCPNCGSTDINRQGYRTTKTQKYQRYQCNVCGTWSQSRFTEVPPETRHNVLKNI